MANSSQFAVLVNKQGTEEQFYDTLVKYILALDTRITCDTTAEDEFNDEDPTHIPTFNFFINEKKVFNFTRPAALSTAVRAVDVTPYVSSSYSSTTKSLYFDVNDGGAVAYNTVINRGLCLAWIVSDNFILIDFVPGPSNHRWWGVTSIYFKSGSNHYGSCVSFQEAGSYVKGKIFKISDLAFYNHDTSVSGTFQTRFSYKQKPGKLDYIKSSIYLSSGVKQFDTNAIYDCTDVVSGETVSLNDGLFIAVGTNQIVKSS